MSQSTNFFSKKKPTAAGVTGGNRLFNVGGQTNGKYQLTPKTSDADDDDGGIGEQATNDAFKEARRKFNNSTFKMQTDTIDQFGGYNSFHREGRQTIQ